MKTKLSLSLALLVLAQQGSAATESVDDVARRLRTTMLETEVAYRPIADEIAAATPEQREKLVAAVLRITEDALKEPQPRSHENSLYIVVSACVLWAVADESAILTAFGSNLRNLGADNLEYEAIRALSVCQDPRAVEAMADLARLRMQELRGLLPQLPPPGSLTDKQKRVYGDISIRLHDTLRGLAKSASPLGKNVARRLRDEYVTEFDGSPWRQCILQDLAAELDPLLQDAPQSARPRGSAPAATPTAKSKQLQQSKSEQPATGTTSEPEQSSSSGTMLIAGVLAALVLLGVLIWFLRKK